MDPKQELLRHAVATLAYRGGKVIRDAPAGFGDVRIADNTRSAAENLAHIGDVVRWAVTAAVGKPDWKPQPPGSWSDEVERFYAALRQLDEALSQPGPLPCQPEMLLQGPIADALTHIGQLATLRRVAGAGVRGEDYTEADVVVGRVGPEQSRPRAEFD